MGLFSFFGSRPKPPKSKARSLGNMGEFRARVISALAEQREVESVLADASDSAKFSFTIGDRSSTADLSNLFGYLNAYPEEDVDSAVGRFMNALTLDGAESTSEDSVVCVIRSRDYIDDVKAIDPTILCEPLGADLWVLYMADRPDSMAPLTSADMPEKNLEEVRQIALSNVRNWLGRVVADAGLYNGVLYYVEDNTMLSTSLLLVDESWDTISGRFPGDVLLALPRKDQLFLFDDDGPKSRTRALARQLIQVTLDEGFNLLSPLLYARRNGEIEVVSD
jgi:uncharacterized protein YtpQ (UPF0354 family)